MRRYNDRTGIKRGKAGEYISVIGRNRDSQVPKGAALNRTMKLLVLALTVALLFTAGEALDCHRCVPKSAGASCQLTVETCKPEKDGCAAARFLRAPHGHYQKCMSLEDCEMLKMNAFIDIKCCSDDMCNTFDNLV